VDLRQNYETLLFVLYEPIKWIVAKIAELYSTAYETYFNYERRIAYLTFE
jgi:hypothetical protein